MLVASPIPVRRRNWVDKPDVSGSKHLETLQHEGGLRVGVSGDMAPFSSRNSLTGQFSGLEVDLAKYFAIALFGCDTDNVMSYLEFVETPFALRSAVLVERDVDVVLSVFADTMDRRRVLTFSGHYMAGKPAVLTAPHSPPISGVDDLNGIRVSVLKGSTGEAMMRSHAPNGEAITFETATECVEALTSHRVEAFWSTTAENTPYLSQPLSTLSQATLDLPAEPWAFALNKSSQDVSRFINVLMGELVSAGKLPRLMYKWLGSGFV